jgi:LysR family cys regulon transcriptional activator
VNLQQLRFVQEAVRRQLNLTEAAKALHTSQPGVSKGIIELEDELGIEIFARHGKRIKRVTEPGQHVLASIEIILREVNNLKRIGQQYSAQDSGTLSIATTHTQARYVLPGPVSQLRQSYPKVGISLHQGAPDQAALLRVATRAGAAIRSSAAAARKHCARRLGHRAADHLPPQLHRPHTHRCGVCAARVQAQRGA